MLLCWSRLSHSLPSCTAVCGGGCTRLYVASFLFLCVCGWAGRCGPLKNERVCYSQTQKRTTVAQRQNRRLTHNEIVPYISGSSQQHSVPKKREQKRAIRVAIKGARGRCRCAPPISALLLAFPLCANLCFGRLLLATQKAAEQRVRKRGT